MGYETRDVDVAIEVMIAITVVDRALFPRRFVPVRIAGSPKRGHWGHLAAYIPPGEKRYGESYYVVIPGIADELGWATKHRPLFREVSSGQAVVIPQSRITHPCMFDVCMSTAAHEVRHRLQCHYGSELCTFRLSKKGACPPFGVIIRKPLVGVMPDFVQYFDFPLIRKSMVRRRCRPVEVRQALSNREFDAYVIELLTLHRMARGVYERDLIKVLRQLLWTGPTNGR